MSIADPKTIGLLPETRVASRQAWADRRLSVLERGGGSPGGGGASPVTSVADTTNIDLNVTSGQLTADIFTTAIPQVARLGVGKAAAGTALLSVDGAGLTTPIWDDTQDGELAVRFAGLESPGTRYNIYHGSAAAPNTTAGSTFKVSTYQDIAGLTHTEGADFIDFSAIAGVAKGLVNTTAQPVGVSGTAISISEVGSPPGGATGNDDALGVVGYGIIQGSGEGWGIGSYFVGARSTDTGVCYCTEFTARNATATAGVYSTSGASTVMGQWITLNDNDGGGAIVLGNPHDHKWDVGLTFVSGGAFGGPCSDSSIADYGTADTSLFIAGTHSNAAVAIDSGSGKLLVGALSSSSNLKALIKSSASDMVGLTVQAAASQSASIIRVSNSADALVFAIGPSVLTFSDNYHMTFNTTTGTKIGTATTQKIGFYNATPIVQPSAYTQTYATASKTNPSITNVALTDNTGGTASATLQALPDPADAPATADALRDDLVTNLIPILRNNYADLVASIGTLRADMIAIKQFTNAIVDDLQALGLVG